MERCVDPTKKLARLQKAAYAAADLYSCPDLIRDPTPPRNAATMTCMTLRPLVRADPCRNLQARDHRRL